MLDKQIIGFIFGKAKQDKEDSDVDVDVVVKDADDDIVDTNAATHIRAHQRPLDVLISFFSLTIFTHLPDVLVLMKSDPKFS